MVKGELVQFPWVSGVGPSRTCAVPSVVVVVGALVVEGDVAPDEAGAWVVTLAAPGVVVTADELPAGGGSL